MKVISIVGARPQFVKLAPVSAAFQATRHDHRVIHTGQHYDHSMSGAFFEELEIPTPHWDLGIGSASHGAQTGAMLTAIEEVLEEERPDWVLVYGDTNSTLAGALAAVKLELRIAHIEAGLRSFNRRMPEEHNRVLTDHAADLLFAPTRTAMQHLAAEGLQQRAVHVGDVMVDALFAMRQRIEATPEICVEATDGLHEFLVATIHRAENTDDAFRLSAIIQALAALPTPVLLIAHPRLRARADEYGIELGQGAVEVHDPLSYGMFVRLLLRSVGLITDSGGLQKEAYILGVPCTTLRAETEWPETLRGGSNMLVADVDRLSEAVYRLPPTSNHDEPFGTVGVATAICRALE